MKKSLVLLLAFLVLITSFSGPAASIHANTSEAGDAIIRSQEQAVQSADEKIEAEVQQALEDNEYVEVLIQLADQVDTAQVAAETKQTLTQSVTAYQQKMESRFAVVDALKTTAETSQASVLSYLEQENENGNVKHIRSFYIMNIIAVQATEEVIEELSRKPEIASIKLDEKFEIEMPEEIDSDSAEALAAEDDSVEWNIDRIQAPDVWDTYNIDGDGVVVGVIDTGVDWTHEALKQQWRGYDPEDPDNPDPHGNWFDAVDGEEMPYYE
jgi:tetrahydromethanopterin S-methyltransferase subunit B